ncbi:mediator complex subunit MED14-domain-containing protein [Halteromyces radiatus]|uniref:mediator complex subunit MED14-domain-containing protein n=1 Tax=Halteromyces radiatus TaxID=101107 RepID=UPI00221FB1B1|nr:mediator complex subunit MED14-domain-containing protein [Halteromyces radiatus]KAI8083090.1 mediator complex subunit MED14-domain-containing protein [Halteromyces radiatus]
MVPLRTLVGKMINKAHADLMTLTDTLPSMSDVERKRQILNYTTFTRKQFLKLMNIMAFLANQNKTFQDTVDFLHKIHIELPAARVRNFDILTAVDVLTTGTYQRMPTKIEDMLPPKPLTDQQVLETFEKMNDEIRIRMLTKEVLPSPMQQYRIENGRVYFCVENEFEVSLTLMGNSDDRKWWIISLDVLVQPSSGGSAADVDISLNENQRQRLRANAQRQLTPPSIPKSSTDRQLFFPLVNLYDYIHLFCLNMQLEIIYIQATMMAKTRWLDQLKVHMNSTRTHLTLIYWGGGSPTAHWGSPQASSIAVRDELKGLIQKSGIGASVSLADLDETSRNKVYCSLKYPKSCLDVLWSGSKNLHTNETLLNSMNMNVELLLLHVTNYHKHAILGKFRQLLKSQSVFLEENGLHLVSDGQPLVIRYRHDRYIHIDFDSRVGRVKVYEAGKNSGDGDVKLSGLEDRLNTDPINIGRHLLWLRSEVVVHEIVSLAKQLNLQPFHPSQMLLRADDMMKLFGDLPTSSPDLMSSSTSSYPQHCVFLQFSQFEDWYLVVAVIRNEFQSSLCCLNTDQNAIYQEFADLIHVDYDQVWKERFINGRNDDLELKLSTKKRHNDISKDIKKLTSEQHSPKRRRTMDENDLLPGSLRRTLDKTDK